MEEALIIMSIISFIALIVFFVVVVNISKLVKQNELQTYYLSKISKTNEDLVLKKEKLEYFEIAGKIKIKSPDGNVMITDRDKWARIKNKDGFEKVPFRI